MTYIPLWFGDSWRFALIRDSVIRIDSLIRDDSCDSWMLWCIPVRTILRDYPPWPCKIFGVAAVYIYPVHYMCAPLRGVCCGVCCGNKIPLARGVQGVYLIVGFVQIYLLYRPVLLVSMPLIKNTTASKIPIARYGFCCTKFCSHKICIMFTFCKINCGHIAVPTGLVCPLYGLHFWLGWGVVKIARCHCL